MSAVIYSTAWDRDRRLRQLRLDRKSLIEVVKAMVSARANCSDNDAKSAPGYLSWNAGVRQMRDLYLRRGWERETLDGIETIKHSEAKIRVTVVNTDEDTGRMQGSPRNRTPKGPAAARVVDLNGQIEMFPGDPAGKPATDSDGCSIWHLCVFDDGANVRAELSRPVEFDSHYFVKFSERIVILGEGEWREIDWTPSDVDDDGEPEVDVRRLH